MYHVQITMTPLILGYSFFLLFSLSEAFNLTLEDGSTYLGEQNAEAMPHGFGKLIKANGDVYE